MQRLWTRPFVSLTSATFFLFAGFYLLMPTMPLYIVRLGGSESQVGFIVGLYTLTAVAARTFVGRQLDTRGRKPLLLIGLIGFALIMGLHLLVSGLVGLTLLRAVHGITWALATTALATAVTDHIPPARLGEGMSWYGLAGTLAMALGPLTAVAIVDNLSYRAMFSVGVLLAAVAVGLVASLPLKFTPPEKTAAPQRINPHVIGVAITVFFYAIVYSGVVTFLPLFADTIGVNSGLFFTVFAISLAAVRLVSGRVADRHGDPLVVVPSLAITIAAVIVLAFTSTLPGIVFSAVLFGLGFGAALPLLQAAAVRLLGSAQRGLSNAIYITAFDLGIGLGSLGLGVIVARWNYTTLFMTTAAAGTASLLIYVLLYRRWQVSSPPPEARRWGDAVD